MIELPVFCVAAVIPVALVVLALAGRDLAGAPDDDYESTIGYDKLMGWVATIGGIIVLLAFMGAAGQGPLAGMVKVVH